MAREGKAREGRGRRRVAMDDGWPWMTGVVDGRGWQGVAVDILCVGGGKAGNTVVNRPEWHVRGSKRKMGRRTCVRCKNAIQGQYGGAGASWTSLR